MFIKKLKRSSLIFYMRFIKVNKSHKIFFSPSIPPKNERNFFSISGLASKNGRTKKKIFITLTMDFYLFLDFTTFKRLSRAEIEKNFRSFFMRI